MQSYFASYFGKMYTVDSEALDVAGVGDVCITLLNGTIWTLQQVRHILNLK